MFFLIFHRFLSGFAKIHSFFDSLQVSDCVLTSPFHFTADLTCCCSAISIFWDHSCLLQNLKVVYYKTLKLFTTKLKVVYYKKSKLFITKLKVVYYTPLMLFTTKPLKPQSCLLQNLKVVYYKT
jgi:hypothetical protein